MIRESKFQIADSGKRIVAKRIFFILLALCVLPIQLARAEDENSLGALPPDLPIFQVAQHCPTSGNLKKFLDDFRVDHHLDDADEHYLKPEELTPRLRVCRPIRLDGASEPLLLLEYDYSDGLPAYWPWRHQLLFRKDGMPLGRFEAFRLKLLKVFPNHAPYLLAINIHRRGSGGHQLYSIRQGKLFKAFDSDDLNFKPQTYNDYRGGNEVNRPAELSLTLRDANGDGWNDLVFSGTVFYDYIKSVPSRTTPSVENDIYRHKRLVKSIFLYNPKSGLFEVK